MAPQIGGVQEEGMFMCDVGGAGQIAQDGRMEHADPTPIKRHGDGDRVEVAEVARQFSRVPVEPLGRIP